MGLSLATGLHANIPFADYCTLEALNASALCWGELSMLHLRAAMDGEMSKDSKDMAVGRAIHARLLEPAVYHSTYTISRGCEAPLKTGARRGQNCGLTARNLLPSGKFACGKHVGDDVECVPANVLTADEAEAVECAATSVCAHNVVKLLRQEGGYETTGVFDRDGVRCKLRLDKWIPSHPAIVDVKKITATRGTLRTIEKNILDYHYDIKAAWYVRGVEILTGEAPAFVWIFVEDGPPYDVRVIQADAETIAIGMHKADDLFYRYQQCMASGKWPGYSDQIEFGGLPAFEKDRHRHITGAKK